MFNHNLRILSFVPRWQIAPRFRTQNVAEHSFFVALYTMQLVEKYEWAWPVATQLAAVRCALQHDIAEARTGDMPGPVKRAIVDQGRLVEYEEDQLGVMQMIPEVFTGEVLALVKVADLIDEYFHVAMEISMGNSLLVRQLEITKDRFHAAVRRARLPWEVAAQVEDEVARMASGFQLPANHPSTDPLTPGPGADGVEEIPF